ncbi:MAG: hypothetical protein EOP07_10195 [Proteobacteria bacterium]|nr:MAG: hypothetical protein EOP07_10195 [Pseudomonadota bacterium]
MQDISKEIHVLMRRRESLVEAFYRGFDPSRLWQEWDLSEHKAKRALTGEGRHFRSYRIPSPSGGLDLALNVAKPCFYSAGPQNIRNWIKACKSVKKLQHPLLPPFEVLEGLNDLVLFVMPYCEEALSLSEQNSPKMSAQINSLRDLLASEGWMMDDYWQLRTCRGYPFVIDFSELKEKPASSAPRLR